MCAKMIQTIEKDVAVIGGGTAGCFAAMGAAALAVKQGVGVSEVKYETLREVLQEQNAIVPILGDDYFDISVKTNNLYKSIK